MGQKAPDGSWTVTGTIPVAVDVVIENGEAVRVTDVRAYDSEFDYVKPHQVHDLGHLELLPPDAAEAVITALEEAALMWPAWSWT